MTSVLNLPKSFDDIQEPALLDEDWYQMRLVVDPVVLPNSVLRKFMEETGTKEAESALDKALSANYTSPDGKHPGLNWVLSLRVVSDNPEFNGRPFKRYLPLPNRGDRERFTANGQSFEDWKMQNIRNEVTAFLGHEPEGNEIALEAGMVAQYYVNQAFNSYREKDENSIEISFAPRAV